MKDNGGPAFPVELPGEPRGKAGPTRHCFPGMTLRDYFAATALTGILTAHGLGPGSGTTEEKVCEAYALADLMIKERNGAD
jgi:hypothetical protein